MEHGGAKADPAASRPRPTPASNSLFAALFLISAASPAMRFFTSPSVLARPERGLRATLGSPVPPKQVGDLATTPEPGVGNDRFHFKWHTHPSTPSGIYGWTVRAADIDSKSSDDQYSAKTKPVSVYLCSDCTSVTKVDRVPAGEGYEWLRVWGFTKTDGGGKIRVYKKNKSDVYEWDGDYDLKKIKPVDFHKVGTPQA